MSFSARLLGLGLLLASVPEAQILRAPESSTRRETPGTFALILDSPAGKAPLALQWDLIAPAAIVIENSGIRVGGAAESAHKSLTCAVNPKAPAAHGAVRFTCILAGGQGAIGNGPVALVEYRARFDLRGVPIRVAVENITGVSAELKKVELPNVDAILHIR